VWKLDWERRAVNYAVRSTVGCALRCAVDSRLVNYAVWRSTGDLTIPPRRFRRAPTTKTRSTAPSELVTQIFPVTRETGEIFL